MVEASGDNLVTEAQRHLDRAYVCEESRDLEKALQECELAIHLAPDSAEAYNLRGVILEQLGQKEQAIAAYREAMQLDSGFVEARENLAEAQAEVHESQRGGRQREALRIGKWGALGFGLGFCIASAIQEAFPSTLDSYATLALNALLYSLGCGLGTVVLGMAARPQRNVGLLVAASGLGCGVSYIAAGLFYRSVLLQLFFELGFPLEKAATVGLTLWFAAVGACTGIVIGAVQSDWRQVGWLAVAGGCGFALYGLFTPFLRPLVAVADPIASSVYRLIGDVEYSTVLFAVALSIRGAIVGSISGGLLGYVVGWYGSGTDQGRASPTCTTSRTGAVCDW